MPVNSVKPFMRYIIMRDVERAKRKAFRVYFKPELFIKMRRKNVVVAHHKINLQVCMRLPPMHEIINLGVVAAME